MTKKKNAVKENKEPVKSLTQMMDITLIDLTGWNPRGEDSFRDEAFRELKQSMKENGFFKHEPLLVRAAGERLQLIAGHRRLQAAKDLSFEVVPVSIQDINDQDAKLLIFLDNLHRKDFSPLEEAQGIKQVLDDATITQTDLAKKMGKSQAYVANRLRLLDAPQELKDLVISQEITPSHVNVLLPFAEYPVFQSIVDNMKESLAEGSISVKDLECDIIETSLENDDSIFNLDHFPYAKRQYEAHFDFANCQDCKDIALVQGFQEKKERYCLNDSCWQEKLDQAVIVFDKNLAGRQKKLLEKAEKSGSVNTTEMQYGTYKSLGDWCKFDKADCEACDNAKRDRAKDLVCLDVQCYVKKEKAWQREQNKKAREEAEKVWNALDEKLSGIKELSESELRFLALSLSTNIIWSAACKKALKPWDQLAKNGHEYPAIKDIPAEDLPRLLLRFVICQRMNGGNGLPSMEDFDRAIEGLGV